MNTVYYGRELYSQNNSLAHYGTKGMKWGYEDGQRVAGKRTAEELMLENIKNKNYAALQQQVNELQKAGHSPQEIQQMLNANIVKNKANSTQQQPADKNNDAAQNSINEAYNNKDYNAIQEQVNKMAKEGRTPEEIEEMLWKAQGLDYSLKGTDKDPRLNNNADSASGKMSKASKSKAKKKDNKEGTEETEKFPTTKNSNGEVEVQVGKSMYTLPKGKTLTKEMQNKLEEYTSKSKKISSAAVMKMLGATSTHGGASSRVKHSDIFGKGSFFGSAKR